MLKLYLDCDGVILDTINKSYQMLKEANIKTESEISKFYNNIDWENLIEVSGQINDSINKIKELTKYFDVEILTHVYSEYEANVKIQYFEKMLPGINVITVLKSIKKADYVNAYGCILVDDYSSNLSYWEEKGGIPVKFSDYEENCPYTVIFDLLELIELFVKNKIKVKE